MSGRLPPDLAAPTASRFGAGLLMLLGCLSSAWSSICARKMRSFLTMRGIIIGVSSVIAVIALVKGRTHSIAHQHQGLGCRRTRQRNRHSSHQATIQDLRTG